MKFFIPILMLLLSFAFCSAQKIEFWNTQRKGANFFNNIPELKRFEDAKTVGIELIRLTGSKWLNGRQAEDIGNFLIGPKDNYNGIVEADLEFLIQVLNEADHADLKVVFTMLSLPGSRWSQHNVIDGKRIQQYDLWKDFNYHHQCADFWRDLATALKDHPAIVGYNILNEPCPERAEWPRMRDWFTMDYKKWYQKVKGTPRDLNLFYKTVIRAIRSVDKETPIILDSGFYANPNAFQIVDPKFLNDPNLIYSIHNYVPARLAFGTTGEYHYPGIIPTGELDTRNETGSVPPFAPNVDWNSNTFRDIFSSLIDWRKTHNIPCQRIYISEFGVNRQAKGARKYLKDSIQFYNQMGWHWSFYSFREDDGYQRMDYELGTGDLPKGYWYYMNDYSNLEPSLYPKPNPLWNVIQTGLKRSPTKQSEETEK